ncbi:IS630 family IS885-like transposase [Streptomyces azureus]|uniref:IS630 family IS885-like transposase n=1 Tax=Streptomyces azureus TaxID=146537 RepID=A0A0K8PJ44_STRAJ|nr:IS630 family IS885-like transposase [Streptomyces azureus]
MQLLPHARFVPGSQAPPAGHARSEAQFAENLANLAACTLSELETLLRRRLKALQYRRSILGGFLAGTDLTLDRPDAP